MGKDAIEAGAPAQPVMTAVLCSEKVASSICQRIGFGGINTIIGSLVVLSTKLSLAQIAPLAMGFYVASLIGKLGVTTFSSYSLTATVNLTVFIAAMSFLQSLYVVAGRAVAMRKDDIYMRSMRSGVVVACGLSVLATAISCGIGDLFALLGMQNELARRAGALGYAAAPGILPAMLLTVFRVHASLKERAGLVTLVYIAGAVIAAVFATAGIRRGEDPDTAAVLAMAAISVANWLMLFMAVVALVYVPALKLPRLSANWSATVASMRVVSSIGWPIGAVVFLDSFASLFAALLAGRLWPAYLPAHAAASLWLTICLVIPLGIAQAAVQKIAVLHAENNSTDRNRVASIAMVLGVAFGVLVAIVFSVYSVDLGHLLLDDTATTAAIADSLRQLMPLSGVLFICQSIIVIAAAALRGIGQTRAPLFLAFMGYGVIATGAQYLFSVELGYSVVGIWWGLIAGFGITAIAVVRNCFREFGRSVFQELEQEV